MKLVVFGDIHQDFEALMRIISQKADLFICHGDLSNLGERLEEAGEILSPLRENLWLLPGNNETREETKNLCQKHGFIDFHDQLKKKEAYTFAGFGFCTPTPFKTPGEVSEAEFARRLKKFQSQKNLILVVHNPPKDSQLDLLPHGLHVGGQALRDFIEKSQPLYCFCGHIHENSSKKQVIGKTRCFNVGKQGFVLTLA